MMSWIQPIRDKPHTDFPKCTSRKIYEFRKKWSWGNKTFRTLTAVSPRQQEDGSRGGGWYYPLAEAAGL